MCFALFAPGALRHGLVSRVVPADVLEEEVRPSSLMHYQIKVIK